MSSNLKFCIVISAFLLVKLPDATVADGKRPYNVEFDQVQPLPESDPSFITYDTLRLSKISRDMFSLSGNFTLLKNLGNEEILGYSVFKKKSYTGQFNTQPIVTMSKPVCEYIKSETKVYPKLVKVSNLPPVEKSCPLGKNQYTIDNFTMTSDELPSIIPPGEYKVLIFAMKNKKIIIGYSVIIKVV